MKIPLADQFRKRPIQTITFLILLIIAGVIYTFKIQERKKLQPESNQNIIASSNGININAQGGSNVNVQLPKSDEKTINKDFQLKKAKVKIEETLEDAERDLKKFSDGFEIEQIQVDQKLNARGLFPSGDRIASNQQLSDSYKLKVDVVVEDTKRKIRNILLEIELINLEAVPEFKAENRRLKKLENASEQAKTHFQDIAEQIKTEMNR